MFVLCCVVLCVLCVFGFYKNNIAPGKTQGPDSTRAHLASPQDASDLSPRSVDVDPIYPETRIGIATLLTQTPITNDNER